jgi:SAM-dependent methyltransferase
MDEYKNQYNKTYYEDEINLRSLAKRRLQIIHRYTSSHQKSLLEIGCAAGFFLDEAKKLGWKVRGLEISPTEVEFAQKTLGLDVKSGSIDLLSEDDQFDVICLFFVMEHIPDYLNFLNQLVQRIPSGGFIALALPSMNGPSFKTSPEEWFKTHPKDHFYDFTPKSLGEVMVRLGFQILYAEPMSYHPQRDKGWRGKLPGFLYRSFSKFTVYGDTFQILAQKK